MYSQPFSVFALHNGHRSARPETLTGCIWTPPQTVKPTPTRTGLVPSTRCAPSGAAYRALGIIFHREFMSLIAFATNGLLRALGWAAPTLLRRKFCKTVLAELIDFDILPRHEALRIDLGPTSTFNLIVVVTNRSPFTVELDRAKIELLCAGHQLECYIIERRTIQPSAKQEFYLRGHIPNEVANAIHAHLNCHQTGISATMEFNCSVQNFPKRTPHLSGVRPEFVNIEWRSKCASNINAA